MLKWGLSGEGSNLLKSRRPLMSTTPRWLKSLLWRNAQRVEGPGQFTRVQWCSRAIFRHLVSNYLGWVPWESSEIGPLKMHPRARAMMVTGPTSSTTTSTTELLRRSCSCSCSCSVVSRPFSYQSAFRVPSVFFVLCSRPARCVSFLPEIYLW